MVGCSYVGMPERRSPIRNFIGTNMSFRREALEASGGFSSELGRVGADASGCEETELCIRITGQSERDLIYDPAARVEHRVPETRGTWRYFTRRCYQEGRSKATVARLAGKDQALASERAYLRSVIPRRVVGCLSPKDTEAGGVSMAAAVVWGVAATVMGYLGASLAPRTERNRVRPGSWRGWLGLAAIALIWLLSFAWSIDINQMRSYGLLSVLPFTYWLAFFLLTLSFWNWVRWRRGSTALLAAHLIVLVAMLHATPAIIEGTVRYSWSYKHIGVTDYIIRHHGVDRAMPNLTAYQDWPGFFALNALFVSGSGIVSALSYAAWAPFVNELLLLAPLLLVFRFFTANRTVIWTAAWLFYLGNWVGQDYFSPQAFGYILYVVAIGVVLRWFVRLPATRRMRRSFSRHGIAPPGPLLTEGGLALSPEEHAPSPAMYAVVVVLATAIAMSHQLTPFMLTVALGVLLVIRRLRSWTLFVAVAAIGIGWVFVWGLPLLHQKLPGIIQTLGHPFDNTTSTFISLSVASPDQVIVAKFDRLLTGLFGLLAVLGAWRAWRSARWRRWVPAACLALTPIAAVFASNYGSEVLFRVFLFALPFFALFAATVLAPTPMGNARRRAVRWISGLVVVSVLSTAFFFAYYGKERVNFMPGYEVSAIEQLYASAPPGSLMLMATANSPWGFAHYENYQYSGFLLGSKKSVNAILADPASALAQQMNGYTQAYLIFTPTEAAQIEMTGLLPPGSYQAIERAVLASPLFKKVIVRGDVIVLTLASAP